MAENLVRIFRIMGHSATDKELPALKQKFITGYHNLDKEQMSRFDSLTKRGEGNSMYNHMVEQRLIDGKIEHGTSYGGGSLSSKSIKRKSNKRRKSLRKKKSTRKKSTRKKSTRRKSSRKKLSRRRR
jgi:hypothetical protein